MNLKAFIFAVSIPVFLVACQSTPSFGEEVIDKTFVLQEEMFLYQRGAEVTLSPPGRSSDVPPSVKCYRTYPNNWMYSAEARSRGVSSDIDKVRVLAVLPAGTEIKVTHFTTHESIVGTMYTPYGVVNDPRFADTEVRFFGLFDGTGGGDFDLRPRSQYLRPAE